ncbi:MAG: type II toxin-antitoxin system RelE/ParE family toxin [Dehalococcoidia bacterium]
MPPAGYTFTRPAERDFARLPVQAQQRIVTALDRYVGEERRGDVKKLAGGGDEWRLRVGDWRLRFRYSEDGRTLVVVRVRPRGRAYRD